MHEQSCVGDCVLASGHTEMQPSLLHRAAQCEEAGAEDHHCRFDSLGSHLVEAEHRRTEPNDRVHGKHDFPEAEDCECD